MSAALVQFEIVPTEIKRNMLLHIYEDIHGYIYEPHSEQSEYYYTTFEGSEVLRASGWKPYCMHRVSRFVHEALLIDGWLVYIKLLPRSSSVKVYAC
jgi:hypothetical protein